MNEADRGTIVAAYFRSGYDAASKAQRLIIDSLETQLFKVHDVLQALYALEPLSEAGLKLVRGTIEDVQATMDWERIQEWQKTSPG